VALNEQNSFIEILFHWLQIIFHFSKFSVIQNEKSGSQNRDRKGKEAGGPGEFCLPGSAKETEPVLSRNTAPKDRQVLFVVNLDALGSSSTHASGHWHTPMPFQLQPVLREEI
jgi:hypothetical protein